MFLRLLLPVFLTFLASSLPAQFSSIEVYGGIGTSIVPPTITSNSFQGNIPVSRGENFSVNQFAQFTNTFETTVSPQFNSRVGVEGHLKLSESGSLYFGIGINALRFSYNQRLLDQVSVPFGSVDTIFFDNPISGGGGGSIGFCQETSFNAFNNSDPTGFLMDVGAPVGYRHVLLKGRLALRAQVSVNVPLVVNLRQETTRFDTTPEGCLNLSPASVDLTGAHQVSSLLFRAGGGFDVRISHSFSLGLLFEQQLNDYFTSTDSFAMDDGVFATVPQVTAFKPFTAQVVGRYLIR